MLTPFFSPFFTLSFSLLYLLSDKLASKGILTLKKSVIPVDIIYHERKVLYNRNKRQRYQGRTVESLELFIEKIRELQQQRQEEEERGGGRWRGGGAHGEYTFQPRVHILNAEHYNILIWAQMKADAPEAALKTFEAMKAKEHPWERPNLSTYRLLVDCLGQRGRWKECVALVDEAKSRRREKEEGGPLQQNRTNNQFYMIYTTAIGE